MQTVINRFAAFDKTVIKQFVTVVGVISFFVLSIVSGLLAAFAPSPDVAIGFIVASVIVAAVTGVVGKEYFVNA
jgi:hypothetical protein